MMPPRNHPTKTQIMIPSLQNTHILTTLTALVIGLGATVAEENKSTTEWPAVPGAVFAQRDANNVSPVVAFDSKGRSLMAFNSEMRGRALPGRFYELICQDGSFHAMDAGTWVGAQVAQSGEFTIEVNITPDIAEPESPGVIFAFGNDDGDDFSLRQEKAGLSLTLGKTKPIALFAPGSGKPVHVLIACGKEKWTAYRDGKPVGSGEMPADLPKWSARELTMGASWSRKDPWLGRMEAIALFPRALTAEEASTQAAASTARHAERKPATTLRFKGTLVNQANTSTLEEIQPYTRSLSFAQYKVDEVLEGTWDQPTIVVAHWMILDAVRLPIADRSLGTKVEYNVQLMEDHPQLESSRRDEIENLDLDVVLFYCESEAAP